MASLGEACFKTPDDGGMDASYGGSTASSCGGICTSGMYPNGLFDSGEVGDDAGRGDASFDATVPDASTDAATDASDSAEDAPTDGETG
jgi:hypothetical protein